MSGIIIRDHWTDADIELIIEEHRSLYRKEYGFDDQFGDYVKRTLQGKIERLWIAERERVFAGCIGLVEQDSHTGQLRWLLVDAEFRGIGLGRELMQKLIDYCRLKDYEKILLWTVNKLPAARALYQQFGFLLSQEKPEELLWGQCLIEQRWDLSL